MAEEKEILRYELDLADVEAKAQRLRILTEQMRAATAKGENTEELQKQIQGEVNALGAMGIEQKKAASTTEDLLRAKEKLTSAVSLMGGTFSGATGQVANMIQMIISANPAVTGMAAGLAALTVGIQVYRSLAEEAEKAAKAQRDYNDAIEVGQKSRETAAASVGTMLEQWGKRSGANVAAGLELQQRLQQGWGAPEALATKAAALSAGAGLGEEDAAILRVLLGGGAQIGTPEEALAALAGVQQRGARGALLDQAQAYAADAIGVQQRIASAAPRRGGLAGMSAERSAYEALKSQPGGLAASGFPQDMTLEQFTTIASAQRRMVEIAREHGVEPGPQMDARMLAYGDATAREFRHLRNVSAGRAWVGTFVDQIAEIQAGGGVAGAGDLFNPPLPAFSDAELAGAMMDPWPGQAGPNPRSVRGAVTIINQTNIGTSIGLDTNRRRKSPGDVKMGGSDADVLTPY